MGISGPEGMEKTKEKGHWKGAKMAFFPPIWLIYCIVYSFPFSSTHFHSLYNLSQAKGGEAEIFLGVFFWSAKRNNENRGEKSSLFWLAKDFRPLKNSLFTWDCIQI